MEKRPQRVPSERGGGEWRPGKKKVIFDPKGPQKPGRQGSRGVDSKTVYGFKAASWKGVEGGEKGEHQAEKSGEWKGPTAARAAGEQPMFSWGEERAHRGGGKKRPFHGMDMPPVRVEDVIVEGEGGSEETLEKRESWPKKGGER